MTIPATPVIPEAISEFQIQTNPYNAENDRNLDFPEDDPTTPATGIGGFFSIGDCRTAN